MERKIRIGTRDSKLSVAQAMLVVQAMKKACPDKEFELVDKKTIGDKILDRPLVSFGGKGVFVSEFEEGLLRGEIDFAVHSAKDLPMDLAKGLDILGVLPREDRRDVLVVPAGKGLGEKISPLMGNHPGEEPGTSVGKRPGEEPGTSVGNHPEEEPGTEGGSRGVRTVCIGTSSLRRSLQIRELGKTLWPGCRVDCKMLRGNVLTRLDKLEQGLYDGIILAAAGLKRLNVSEERKGRYRFYPFSEEEMIPAGGQGIIVIEGRKEDDLGWLARAVNHEQTMEELTAERLVLKRLNSGCHEPVGVSCKKSRSGVWVIEGIYEKDGRIRRARVEKASFGEHPESLEEMALLLAEKLLAERQIIGET